jgi:hypothetical protein
MPPEVESGPQSRKRRRTLEIAPSIDPPEPPVKRQKRSQRSATPPEFWDNLSRVPLCRRALREFNRRTFQPIAAEPSAPSILGEGQAKILKRFARHGGPNLRDIRGVGCVYAMENHTNLPQYPVPRIHSSSTMSSSQSRIGTGSDPSNAPSQSTRKSTLSSRDPAFEQALIDVGVYPMDINIQMMRRSQY